MGKEENGKVSPKLFNWESGHYEEVSQQAYDLHKNAMDNFKQMLPKLNGIGKIIITSSEPEEGNNGFYELYSQSKK